MNQNRSQKPAARQRQCAINGLRLLTLCALFAAVLWPAWSAASVASPATANTAATAPLPSASETTLLDDRRQRLNFDAPPQRIVSLLPSLTEIVCAVGACARLVGTDRYSNQPAAVRDLPKLGGMDDAQVEGIVALKPDLVLAARSTRAVERLEALGLKVAAFDSDNHAQVRATLIRLGALFGGRIAAEGQWASIMVQIGGAAQRLPPAWLGRTVYVEVDATPFAAGASSFVGQTLSVLGLSHIVPPAMGPFPKLNPEFVVRSQPDLIIAAARNIAAMPARPGWDGLHALQQQRVCALDAEAYELVTRPGPRLGPAANVLVDCIARLTPPATPLKSLTPGGMTVKMTPRTTPATTPWTAIHAPPDRAR